jgi:hypothetical protein
MIKRRVTGVLLLFRFHIHHVTETAVEWNRGLSKENRTGYHVTNQIAARYCKIQPTADAEEHVMVLANELGYQVLRQGCPL